MTSSRLLLLLFLMLLARPGHSVTAAEYRRLAEGAVAGRQYARAAFYYKQEASIYRKKGDVNGAKVEEMKAGAWSTEVDLFTSVPSTAALVKPLYTGAKFEPMYGCYLGAYVSADESLAGPDESYGSSRYAARASALGEKIHKHLATAWDYCSYGESFPSNWAKALMEQGIAPHIAWEPNHGMADVQDNDYLQQFARDAAACDGPIFLRFAGEMNGDWTPWHNDPSLYKTKFRLVHDVMARLAPNIAMIWCVNQIPEYNMDEYYPGDEYVDWVGVNLYSVLHHDNDPTRPSASENPASLVDYVYSKYSIRKPIAICEYGASHKEKLDPGKDHSDIASIKLAEMFAALPRRFPRVKLIGIFDCDNLTVSTVVPGRQLNDYSVTDSPGVLAALTHAVAPDYFLKEVVKGEQKDLPPLIQPLEPGAKLSGNAPLSAWVKTYSEKPTEAAKPTVIYSLDSKEIARLDSPGPYELDLDTSRYGAGKHLLAVDVLDSAAQKAAHKEVAVSFAAAPKAVPPPVPPSTTAGAGAKPTPAPTPKPTEVSKPSETTPEPVPPVGPLDTDKAGSLGLALLACAGLVCLLWIFSAIRSRRR